MSPTRVSRTPSFLARAARAAGLSALIAASAIGAPGYIATARAEEPTGRIVIYGYEADYVATVPIQIEIYPQIVWRGRPAYYAGGRWYYRRARGWVVLRQEPRELSRYRIQIQGRPVEVERHRAPPPRRRHRHHPER